MLSILKHRMAYMTVFVVLYTHCVKQRLCCTSATWSTIPLSLHTHTHICTSTSTLQNTSVNRILQSRIGLFFHSISEATVQSSVVQRKTCNQHIYSFMGSFVLCELYMCTVQWLAEDSKSINEVSTRLDDWKVLQGEKVGAQCDIAAEWHKINLHENWLND